MFTGEKIGNVSLKNRWIMLAMHTGYAEGNALGEREIAFYEERAKGGVGAITMVLGVNNAGSLQNMHHAEELQEESLRGLAQMLHSYDCKLIVQLFHCGRGENGENHNGKSLLAPSAVASSIFKTEPVEMTPEDLGDTKCAFAKAALLCKNAGADIIEISASSGYLLSEFLSPLTNLRTDEYGYETGHGQTYPLEVLREVRETVGDMTVIMKVSAVQMMDGGYGIEDTILLCRGAEKEGLIQGIAVTGGWHESPVEQSSYHVSKGAYAPLAGMIKKNTSLPVIACNRIQDSQTAQRILDENSADFVGSARAFLCDAHFVEKLQCHRTFLPCQGCNHCILGVLKGDALSCAFEPEAGNEYFEKQRRKVATRKEVLVIGGGPAGMEAAKKAADRGFVTTLMTEENSLGGQLKLAALPPKKQDLKGYISYMEEELRNRSVKIVASHKATVEEIIEKGAYLTVIATGSLPKHPAITGMQDGIFAQDLLGEKVSLPPQSAEGKTVIIGGGIVGLETAAFLIAREPERKVTVVEAKDGFGKDLGAMARPLLASLRQAGVSLMANTQVDSVTDGRVNIRIAEQKFFLQADAIIIATGSEENINQEIMIELLNHSLSYAIVGDADCIGGSEGAIKSAYSLFQRVYLA